MLIILALLGSGVVTGFLLRRHPLKFLPQFTFGVIALLLFVLGVEVGGNPEIIHGLTTIGYDALLITAGGVSGSVIAAWLLGRDWHRKRTRP